MASPYFSFITATYNRASLIQTTIEKMLAQTFQDFEIILIDDGSTDDTQKIILEKYKSEHRLKYFLQTNRERGSARNSGIQKAIGKYLVFVDSDDTISKDHLENIYRHLIRLGEPNFITTKYDIEESGNYHPAPIFKLKEGWYDYRILLKGNILGMYCAARRENANLILFEESRNYSIMEDWIFNLANLRKDRIYLTSDVTYHLTNHPERSMLSDYKKVIQRKRNATEWAVNQLALSKREVNQLETGTKIFETIHYYLGSDRSNAFKSLYAAIRSDRLRISYFILAFKITFGSHIIKKFKSLMIK